MLVDLNGIEYHVRVSHTEGRGMLYLRMVDEAFTMVPLRTRAFSAQHVVRLVEDYAQTQVDAATALKIKAYAISQREKTISGKKQAQKPMRRTGT